MALFHTTVVDNQIKALDTIGNVSGSICTFETDRAENLIEVVCDIQCQQASGTPTPSDPLPITTYTSLNLFSGSGEPKSYTIEQGQINQTTGADESSTTIKRTSYIDILPNQLIKLTFETSVNYSRSYRIFWYGQNGESDYIGTESVGVPANKFEITKYAPNNAYFVRIHAANVNMGFVFNVQTFNVTNIPFGQTVYGGRLNVGSGVLTVTHKCVKVSDYTWYKGTTGTYARFYTTAQLEIKLPESQSSSQTIFSDNYATALSFNALLSTNNVIAVNPTATGPAINITDDRFTTGADFASNMGNTDIVFELATTSTIQLDSKQIQTIANSVNNIYADTGDIIDLKFVLSVGKAIS